MAIVLRGMTAEETAWLTDAMVHSGIRVDLSRHSRRQGRQAQHRRRRRQDVADPRAARRGVRRAGADDVGPRPRPHRRHARQARSDSRLPGQPVARRDERRRSRASGCAMIGQTAEIAPADKKLYALRDVTGTVESIPLITASIMSKKIAEGIDALVLDVKTGQRRVHEDRGRLAAARRVARRRSATRPGVRTEAIITAMDAPLGRAVGNALEVIECIDVLKGGGPADLDRRVGRADGPHAGARRGRARSRRRRAPRARRDRVRRGPRAVPADHREPGRRSARRRRLQPAAVGARPAPRDGAARTGIVAGLDAELVGRASVALGAGRDRVEDAVDPAVGIMVLAEAGRQRLAPAIRSSSCTIAIVRRLDAALCRWPQRGHRRSATRAPRDSAAHRRRGALMLGRPCSRSSARVVILGDRAMPVSTNRRAIAGRRSPGAWGCRSSSRSSCSRRRSASGVFATLGTLHHQAARVRRRRRGVRVRRRSATRRVGPRHDRRARPRGRRSTAVIFAFQVLPTIIFIAALFAILYYFGVMQLVVRLFAVVMHRVMKASGAESLNVAASIFMGQTEAPLTIRPYPAGDDAVRADDGDDLRHGAHLRRHHGRLHRCSASRPSIC